MKEANVFFDKLLNESHLVSVAKLGNIVKINGDKADIQPLPTKSHSLVLSVPLLQLGNDNMYVHTPYEIGDLVLLVYLDLKSNDCVCVGRVSSKDNNGDSIELAYGNSKITIKEDGISIEADNIRINGDTVTVSGSSESNSWS